MDDLGSFEPEHRIFPDSPDIEPEDDPDRYRDLLIERDWSA